MSMNPCRKWVRGRVALMAVTASVALALGAGTMVIADDSSVAEYSQNAVVAVEEDQVAGVQNADGQEAEAVTASDSETADTDEGEGQGTDAGKLVCSDAVEPVSLAAAQSTTQIKRLADELAAGALTGGSYVVDADTTVCDPIEVQADTVIEIGDATLSFELEGRFHVPAGVKLTIRRTPGAAALAQVVCREADQLVVNEGTTILDGIRVTDGTTCAVDNRAGGDLTLSNCEISGCTEVAVKNAKDATVHLLFGTSIKDNACGVESRGCVAVSGKVIVEGNTQGDLIIGTTALLVEGMLVDGSHMGIAWTGKGAFTKGLGEHNADIAPNKLFFCNGRNDYAIVRDSAGEATYGGLHYLNEEGKDSTVDSAQVRDLSSSDTGWIPMSSGWYTFSRSVMLDGRGSVDGDVKLIIPDKVRVEWKHGIHVRPGCSLTIYGQARCSGELRADQSDTKDQAGIGGNEDESGATITICGGQVWAWGGEDAAGIGGGCGGSGGNITICGHDTKVDATGLEYGAGIGGGKSGDGGTITIHGGDVHANGGNFLFGKHQNLWGAGAGIGGGDEGGAGSIQIDGGKVVAGSAGAAGIGGGYEGEGGSIRILGGFVRGECFETKETDSPISGSAGIGGGSGKRCDLIEIRQATVEAQAVCGAAIGSGEGAKGHCPITIVRSHVNALAQRGSGIGSGGSTSFTSDTTGGVVFISDSDVRAESTWGAAGIGGGARPNWERASSGGSDVTIKGNSTVEAMSNKGAAIGRGVNGPDDAPGQVHLDDHLKVLSFDEGRSDGSYRLAPAAEREGYCKYRNHVKVEPCDHQMGACEAHGECHIRHCSTCLKSVEQEHSFDKDGCCQDCHYTKPAPSFADCTWSCDDAIRLCFPVEIPTEYAERFDGSYMELSLAGKSGRCLQVPLAGAECDAQGRKVFSIELSVLEMAQPVKAVFHYGSDQQVETTVALKDCLERDAKKGGQADMVLTRSLANFGHCLQDYLAKANGWTIGKDYADMSLFYEGVLDAGAAQADLAAHCAKSSTEGTAVANVGMSVVFGATTAVNLNLKPRDGVELTGKASFDGREVELTRMSNGSWHVHVEGIRACDFDKKLVVEGDCGGAFSVEVSVLAYAANAYSAKGATDTTKAAMASVWQYHKAVVDCVNLRVARMVAVCAFA